MAVRQYIGARYTIKIYENSLDPSSAEWEPSVAYEPLTMVTYNNSTYLSKKQVPGSVGDPANNPSYWAVTGYYNGQIMQLQNDILAIHEGFVTPEMFGAAGDGVTDDTAAIQDAIDSAGCVIFTGTYLISDSINLHNGSNLIGYNATVKVYDNTRILNGMFMLDSIENVSISGIIFDMNMQNMPAYTENRVTRYNIGLFVKTSGNIVVRRCSFINLYNQAISLYDTYANVTVEDCFFDSPLQTQSQCAEFIVAQTITDGTININRNTFKAASAANADNGVCAFSSSGTSSVLDIAYNNIINCGRNNTGTHRLAPIDLYGDVSNAYIIGNRVESLHMFVRIEDSDNVHVEGNCFEDISQDREANDEAFIWVDFVGVYPTRDTVENIYIRNNELICSGNKEGCVIQIWNAKSSSDKVLNNVVIENNKIAGTTSYPPIKTDGRCNDLIIKNNSITAGSTVAVDYETGAITTEVVNVNHHVISDNYLKGVRGLNIMINRGTDGLSITGMVINGNTVDSSNESIQTTIQAVISNNIVNNGIWSDTADTNYSLACNNIFDASVATPISGATILHKDNAQGNSLID